MFYYLKVNQPWASLLVSGRVCAIAVDFTTQYRGNILIYSDMLDFQEMARLGVLEGVTDVLIGVAFLDGIDVVTEKEWTVLREHYLLRSGPRPYGDKTRLWRFIKMKTFDKPTLLDPNVSYIREIKEYRAF